MNSLRKEVEIAELGEINLAWCVLKRQDKKFGIKKKLDSLAYLFDIDGDLLYTEAIKDEDGRILDKENRMLINDILISWNKP